MQEALRYARCMADTELRELERRASAGDARAALDLAVARRRAGRPDAALEALWRACADPSLRAEAACLDLESPLRASPQVAWRSEVRRSDFWVDTLVATPLVVVAYSHLLDPATGRPRGALLAANSLVEGATVVQHAKVGRVWQLVTFDAWTAAELGRVRVPPGPLERGPGGHAVIVRPRELVGLRVSGPGEAPVERWSRGLPAPAAGADPGLAWTATVGPRVVALRLAKGSHNIQGRVELLGLADGAPLGAIERGRVLQVDEHGVVGLFRLDDPGRTDVLAAWDEGGRLLWRLERPGRLVCRSHDALVWSRDSMAGSEVSVVDRRSGVVRATCRAPTPPAGLVGDVLFFADAKTREISARSQAGEELWSWRPTGAISAPLYPPRLAFLPGRVLVLDGAALTCLVAP